MPLSPIDDIKTYRSVADKAYSRGGNLKFRQGMAAAGEPEAGDVPNPPAVAPAAMIPGVKFSKPFTPAERALQALALQKKLQERDNAGTE